MKVSHSVSIANANRVLAYLISEKPDREPQGSEFGVLKMAHANELLIDETTLKPVAMAAQAGVEVYLVPQLDNIPLALKELPRWLVWHAEAVSGAKPRKVPYNPTLLNSRASSTDLGTWGTFAQAEAAYEEGGRTGVGFVLNGDGVVGIDIDNCVVGGMPNPAAMNLFAQLACKYVEFSPSGTGLRGFGYSEGLVKGCKGKYNGLDVELYSTSRYLTITGHVVVNGPVAPLSGFKGLAETIQPGRVINQEAGQVTQGAADKRHAELVSRILSGDVYHDSLRDLSASLIATGMKEGAVVNHLRGLMENVATAHDGRWQARVADIPKLVDSAVKKYAPPTMDLSRLLQGQGVVPAERELPNRFKILTAAQLAQAEPIKWMIRGLFPQVGLAALYGPSGSGKSFLTLDLSASVASGISEWYGMRITQCPVTYCVLEGEGGMGKRVAAWEGYRAKKMPNSLRFIVQQFDITITADVEELASAIRAAGGTDGLIVLDTLNRASPGSDENSSKDMGVIIANAKALQELTGGMVLLVHHTGKDESKGMRGHSSLFAAMDCVIGVMRTRDEGLGWTVTKSKDDETGTQHAFRLEQVVVGQDEDGENITSCVAVSVAPPFAQKGARKLGQHQRTARDVLLNIFNESEGDHQVTYVLAYDAIAAAINVDPKHKRERAKQAVAGLAGHGMIEMTDTHIVRLPAFGN